MPLSDAGRERLSHVIFTLIHGTDSDEVDAEVAAYIQRCDKHYRNRTRQGKRPMRIPGGETVWVPTDNEDLEIEIEDL